MNKRLITELVRGWRKERAPVDGEMYHSPFMFCLELPKWPHDLDYSRIMVSAAGKMTSSSIMSELLRIRLPITYRGIHWGVVRYMADWKGVLSQRAMS